MYESRSYAIGTNLTYTHPKQDRSYPDTEEMS